MIRKGALVVTLLVAGSAAWASTKLVVLEKGTRTPIDDAGLFLTHGANEMRNFSTDEFGKLELPSCESGEMTVTVYKDLYHAYRSQTLTIPCGQQDATIEVELERIHSISLIELIADSEEYHEKLVRVCGFVGTGSNQVSYLTLTSEHWSASSVEDMFVLNLTPELEEHVQKENQFFCFEGRFFWEDPIYAGILVPSDSY